MAVFIGEMFIYSLIPARVLRRLKFVFFCVPQLRIHIIVRNIQIVACSSKVEIVKSKSWPVKNRNCVLCSVRADDCARSNRTRLAITMHHFTETGNCVFYAVRADFLFKTNQLLVRATLFRGETNTGTWPSR
jgi:phosphoribosyl-dephospho-CoA transferase